jgi:hypothetical protein
MTETVPKIGGCAAVDAGRCQTLRRVVALFSYTKLTGAWLAALCITALLQVVLVSFARLK